MKNNLVYIKIGGSFDDCAGSLTDYSPIIYDDTNDSLEIDEKIKISCASWMVPSEDYHNTDVNKKYLICEHGNNYGYLYQGKKYSFGNIKSRAVYEELKDLVFLNTIHFS